MANCIRLILSGLVERDIQLTKRQYFNTTVATSTSGLLLLMLLMLLLVFLITMTAFTTMPKRINVKFSGNF
jgi:hypothetical protein